MMIQKRCFCVCLQMFLSFTSFVAINAAEPKRIIVALAGSSSCQSFNKTDPKLICGWGEVFGEFFQPKIKILNFAVSGRSTKSFRLKGDWEKLLASKPDYILMTLGANDTRGKRDATDVKTEFPNNLIRYANEAKKNGAKLIFVTINQSMTRNKDKKLVFSRGRAIRTDRTPYNKAIREVANKLNLPCLELAKNHTKELEKLGEKEAAKLFRFNPKFNLFDPSHSNRKGAILMARIIVEELRKSNSDLKKYINLNKL